MFEIVVIAFLSVWVLASIIGFANLSRRLKTSNYPASTAADRQEIQQTLKNTTDSLNRQFTDLQSLIQKQLEILKTSSDQKLEHIRRTVDDQLHTALEKRLTENFKRVSQQLESVHKSVGEMQSLATDVGKLQQTLVGTKSKGVWGEAHLSNLLSEVLNTEQYVKDFQPRADSKDKVEFALKIPAADGSVLYLPIDAKLTLTSFEKLQTAITDNLPKAEIAKARKTLFSDLRKAALKISKYINPPQTTNFAIMYLPLESLYGEVAQHTDLMTELRNSFKVTVVGPSTILPMLGVLNMGYSSLAIQQRAVQVWDVLMNIHREFADFGKLLDNAKGRLRDADRLITAAGDNTTAIQRQLDEVQRLEPPKENLKLLEENR